MSVSKSQGLTETCGTLILRAGGLVTDTGDEQGVKVSKAVACGETLLSGDVDCGEMGDNDESWLVAETIDKHKVVEVSLEVSLVATISDEDKELLKLKRERDVPKEVSTAGWVEAGLLLSRK